MSEYPTRQAAPGTYDLNTPEGLVTVRVGTEGVFVPADEAERQLADAFGMPAIEPAPTPPPQQSRRKPRRRS